MAFAGFDAELLGALEEAGASPAQGYLLQATLQGIEPDTPLSQHAAARRGLTAELAQAQSALESFADTGQPRHRLLTVLCANASEALAVARPHSAGDPLLPAAAAAMAPVSAIRDDKAKDKAVARVAAAHLAPLLRQLPAYLERLFVRAWTASPADGGLLTSAALEIAGALAAVDRDRLTLQAELALVLSRYGPHATPIYAVLLPPPAPHRYACVVYGTGELDELDALSAGARQLSGPSAAEPAWGSARPQLVKWLAEQEDSATTVVADIEIVARDRASAARLGRRRLVEVLDQYMAGHRILRLALAPRGFAWRIGDAKAAEDAKLPRGVRRAYPLVPHWPAGLRETLRMAHLARATDSPMAATALAWSAVEATGLGAGRRAELAAAMSLQALRQQVMEAHNHLAQDADARDSYNATRKREAGRNVESLRRAAAQCGPGHPKHQLVRRRLEAAEARLAVAEARETAAGPLRTALAGLAGHCGITPHGYLSDLNSWVDVLLPARAGEPPSLAGARAALATALPMLSPLTRRQIVDWQSRLGDSSRCADWLELTRRRFTALLDAVYAARNLTLHSGVFDTTGDQVLGQGAIMSADLMLEFLGNWYRHSSPPPAAAQPPATVIRILAARQANLIHRLRATPGAAHPLNIGWLTSPSTATAWDRP